jgi:hypothetical protein
MKQQQQMNVYARFIADESPIESARTNAAKARRTGNRAARGSAPSPKQGLKKRAGLPK